MKDTRLRFRRLARHRQGKAAAAKGRVHALRRVWSKPVGTPEEPLNEIDKKEENPYTPAKHFARAFDD